MCALLVSMEEASKRVLLHLPDSLLEVNVCAPAQLRQYKKGRVQKKPRGGVDI